jgi:hypothetical protein
MGPAVAHDVLEHDATTAEGHWHGSLDLALCRDTAAAAAAAAAVVVEEGNHDSMPSFVTVLSPSNIELTNGISSIVVVRHSPWLLDGIVRRQAGGVGGEAWTCDGQTNGINFIEFVCPSPWFLDGRMPAVSAVKHGLVTDR